MLKTCIQQFYGIRIAEEAVLQYKAYYSSRMVVTITGILLNSQQMHLYYIWCKHYSTVFEPYFNPKTISVRKEDQHSTYASPVDVIQTSPSYILQ